MKVHHWTGFLLLCLCILLAGVPEMSIGQGRSVKNNNEKEIQFQPAPGPLDNPLKGWCTYTDAGTIHQPYSMVFKYVSWKELEPTEGHYAFAAWEKRTWGGLSAGKHIVMRVYLDYPSEPTGIPSWLLAQGIKTHKYSDYGGGESPDYDDPKLVSGLVHLIAAMGRRYDKNPRIAFIELGMLGFWGEWHTYPHTTWFASTATQQRIVTAFHKAFPDKILQGRYPTGVLGNLPWIGYFDDMFPADTDGTESWNFLPQMRQSGRMNNWKTAVIGGEMEPGAADQWLGADFATTMTALNAMHMTWIGPYNPALDPNANPQFLANSQAMVRRMGYQYCLQNMRYTPEVTHNGFLRVHINGANQGIAPFYYPWSVRFALLKPNGHVVEVMPAAIDIRRWLPGPFVLDTAVKLHAGPGQYLLGLGIIDPMTHQPAIRFANTLPLLSQWTILGKLHINSR